MESLDLIISALKNVEQTYYWIPTTYSDSGIARERVFCYEFYHQMRLLFDDNSSSFIHGEIDKRGHIDFQTKHKVNPDFVIHAPGSHLQNKVVMEVKGVLKSPYKGILKDFETLLNFTQYYRYQMGVFVIFNHSMDEFKRKCAVPLLKFKGEPTVLNIKIIAKERDKACDVINLSSLF